MDFEALNLKLKSLNLFLDAIFQIMQMLFIDLQMALTENSFRVKSEVIGASIQLFIFN